MTPAALSRIEAAEYVGLSPGSFDKLVGEGRMPRARSYEPHVNRQVWLRAELDAALNDLPTQGANPRRAYEGVVL